MYHERPVAPDACRVLLIADKNAALDASYTSLGRASRTALGLFRLMKMPTRFIGRLPFAERKVPEMYHRLPAKSIAFNNLRYGSACGRRRPVLRSC